MGSDVALARRGATGTTKVSATCKLNKTANQILATVQANIFGRIGKGGGGPKISDASCGNFGSVLRGWSEIF